MAPPGRLGQQQDLSVNNFRINFERRHVAGQGLLEESAGQLLEAASFGARFATGPAALVRSTIRSRPGVGGPNLARWDAQQTQDFRIAVANPLRFNSRVAS
jgi:hypothetical protein